MESHSPGVSKLSHNDLFPLLNSATVVQKQSEDIGKGSMWLCSNKSLFIETEIVISHVHVLKNSISPFGLSQSFQDI